MIEHRSVQYFGVLHWHARWGRLVFIAVTLVRFGLSFLPFTELVTKVFPVIGWLGVLFVAVLLVTWLVSARTHIAEEGLRGDLYQEAERTSGISVPPEEQEQLGEKLSRL
ncbi:hypothetical protein [Kocuria sp. CPCC 204721]|uniref:hypothetical protein n=1 Tax=Kocuria sp. CPCC 204721 TaxID=3073548 RepID=UPI0034D64676